MARREVSGGYLAAKSLWETKLPLDLKEVGVKFTRSCKFIARLRGFLKMIFGLNFTLQIQDLLGLLLGRAIKRRELLVFFLRTRRELLVDARASTRCRFAKAYMNGPTSPTNLFFKYFSVWLFSQFFSEKPAIVFQKIENFITY